MTLTLDVSPEAREVLDELSRLQGGIRDAEVIRRALGTTLYLLKEHISGSKVLVAGKDGNIHAVILLSPT